MVPSSHDVSKYISCRGPNIIKNDSFVKSYQPLIPYPSQEKAHSLEKEHTMFINQVNGIRLNTPFIEALVKMPEYAEFLQDLLETHHQLEMTSKVVINEQFPVVIMEGIPTNMGDPLCIILPCEFGNATNTFDLADSGASKNLMHYHFIKSLTFHN